MEIYALYSKTKKRYYRPIFAEDVESAKAQIVDLIISTNDQVIVNSLDDMELCFLGGYVEDAEHGNPLVEAPDVEIRCEDLVRVLPFPPMVRSKIFKLYGFDDEFPVKPEVKSDAET